MGLLFFIWIGGLPLAVNEGLGMSRQALGELGIRREERKEGVKRRENPVRRHFERSEMRGLRSGIA